MLKIKIKIENNRFFIFNSDTFFLLVFISKKILIFFIILNFKSFQLFFSLLFNLFLFTLLLYSIFSYSSLHCLSCSLSYLLSILPPFSSRLKAITSPYKIFYLIILILKYFGINFRNSRKLRKIHSNKKKVKNFFFYINYMLSLLV